MGSGKGEPKRLDQPGDCGLTLVLFLITKSNRKNRAVRAASFPDRRTQMTLTRGHLG